MMSCYYCDCPIHEEDGSLHWDDRGHPACGPCDYPVEQQKADAEWDGDDE